MQVAVFGTTPYRTPKGRPAAWPVPPASFDPEVGQQTMCESLELLERADQLGFDWVTCAEHHYSPFAMSPNPMLLAGALSQRTRRARIGVLGPTVPLLNPVRVAEEFAMLDNLANGRVIVGLMRGTAFEYNTYSINPSESRDRFEEALQLIVAAWTESQPFGWQGRYYRYRTVSLWPQPVQKPFPPIFMSASSVESGRLAARNHVNIGMAATTVELAAKSAQNYREAAADAGWTAIPENILFRTHGCVAETDEEAWRIAEYFLERPVQLDADTTRALRSLRLLRCRCEDTGDAGRPAVVGARTCRCGVPVLWQLRRRCSSSCVTPKSGSAPASWSSASNPTEFRTNTRCNPSSCSGTRCCPGCSVSHDQRISHDIHSIRGISR